MYALTVFLGAFLLFQVQPIIAKYLLPWFGGGPGVWATCLFFFQIVLLAGYAYAHVLTRFFKPRTQGFVHLLLTVGALVFLPIVPSPSWNPTGEQNPWPSIVLVLATAVGLPSVLLSSTSPLIQRWFSQVRPGASAYRLYVLSNIGSLVALLSYPVCFEAHLSLGSQATMWAWALAFYVVCCSLCSLRAMSLPASPSSNQSASASTGNSPVNRWRWALWLLWPACGSVLLMATTNKLCLDVAVFPLLWILPLSVYLLSFVVCFDNPRWYRPVPYTVALGLVLLFLCWALFKGATWRFANQVFIYCGGLLVCCLVCHGELFRLRPGPTQLTTFYLLIAAGGALGGLFVSLLAPMIFSSYCELNWGLGVLTLLVAARWIFRAKSHQLEGTSKDTRFSGDSGTVAPWRALVSTLVCLASLGIIATLWLQARWSNPDIVHRSRNFYGVLTIFEHRKDEPRGHHFLLQHGRITHGLQLVDPQLQTLPTTYYGGESGIGLALRALSAQARHIGVVGLGAGTLAAYGRSGDSFCFYEINPEVNRVAGETFKYLARSAASCEVTLGDARLNLERQPPQAFDLMALDAFSSDAIPVHLLTKEAFRVYLHHLKTNGILAVHISNHFLDLQQVVLGQAREFGLKAAIIDHDADPKQWWIYSSSWVLLSRDEQFLAIPSISTAAKPLPDNRALPLWTDDFSSLFQILR